MKKISIFILLNSICINTFANTPQETTYSISDLKQDINTTEKLLSDMLKIDRMDLVERLLPIYQGFPEQNPRLVNYAKIKQARVLFLDYQNKAAKQAFQTLQIQDNLNDEEQSIIHDYLQAIEQRENWQFSLGANYLQTKNVNNTSNERHIENTGFVKSDSMLPQAAHGFAYYFDAQKNWNLFGSHYFHFSNNLYGKNYWDNHEYDELTNRSYLGYLYQNRQYKLAVKPFYERQWLGDHRYNWANGARAEYNRNIAKNWQISTAFEFSQPRYFSQPERNGTIKLASITAVWQPSQKGYYYLGTDFIRENTRIKQYSNDMKALRLGWRQNWAYEIATQINASIAIRKYKDIASLGNILPLDKVRKDKIYSLNLTVWKQNWQYLGFVPKIQFRWKKQDSNIPSMFSYSEKYAQMLVEKDF